MQKFVWTKMHGHAGQTLEFIMERKEIERKEGHGCFWWTIGNSLPKLANEAMSNGGSLPMLFSKMPSRTAKRDRDPDAVVFWTAYETANGAKEIPDHVVCLSRETKNRKGYALVCRSRKKLSVRELPPFDPEKCETETGKSLGYQQVTALLEGDLGPHDTGRLCLGFQAKLVDPWFVRLAEPRLLTSKAKALLLDKNAWNDWPRFTARLRALTRDL